MLKNSIFPPLCGPHPFPFACQAYAQSTKMWCVLQTPENKLRTETEWKGDCRRELQFSLSFRMCFAILRSLFISKLRLGFGSQSVESQPLNRSSTMRGSSKKDYSVYDFNAEDEAVESSSRRLAKKFGRLRNPKSSPNPPVTKFTFLKTCKISYIS